MDIYHWINAQIDTIKNCVSVLEENRENIDKTIIQTWALKRHVDAMVDFLERSKKHESKA
jgi:hypothetical protein